MAATKGIKRLISLIAAMGGSYRGQERLINYLSWIDKI